MIEGGRPLEGEVRIQGAKNAALPILAATVLASGESILQDVPVLQDIRVMQQIVRSLGAKFTQDGSTVAVNCTDIHSTDIPDELMRKMRSAMLC